MRRFFGFKYPKLSALLIAIFLAYLFFSSDYSAPFISAFNQAGYLGAFIAGCMFTFGFTTPFATGFFILMNPENVLLYAIVGGFGALIFDLVIFKPIDFSS
ncbi:hypothetical protein H0N95_02155 [Candidatus Micrarchaeota archaeon]|nr:hypothetical protein [Candidatus Micrarchaeota archaeon]